jgi:hypothetical protein
LFRHAGLRGTDGAAIELSNGRALHWIEAQHVYVST